MPSSQRVGTWEPQPAHSWPWAVEGDLLLSGAAVGWGHSLWLQPLWLCAPKTVGVFPLLSVCAVGSARALALFRQTRWFCPSGGATFLRAALAKKKYLSKHLIKNCKYHEVFILF